VIGDDEVQNKKVAVRDRRERVQYELGEDEFVAMIQKKINEVHF
jgi:threonyl-tRNA synthetase